MANSLTCATSTENLINDISTFINGAENSNVTLSDGSVIESYRKYAISDITRTGNKMALKLYYKDDIITYNNDVYVCLENYLVTTIASIDTTKFKKIGNFTSISGNGISGYLNYHMGYSQILSSQGVVSVTKSATDSSILDIVFSDAVVGKVAVIFAADIRNISYAKLLENFFNYPNTIGGASYGYSSGFYQKTIVGRVISNIGNHLTVGINQGAFHMSTPAGNINNAYVNNPTDRDVFSPVVSMAFITY